jgi:hypothetical protein
VEWLLHPIEADIPIIQHIQKWSIFLKIETWRQGMDMSLKNDLVKAPSIGPTIAVIPRV